MNKYPLLIEIGCEDLPPEDVSYIRKESGEKFARILEEKRIDFKGLRVFSTPRRIAVKVAELSSHQNPASEKLKGPPVDVALKDGKPTPAGLGFAKKAGVDFKDLKIEETPRGKYFCCIKEYPGAPVRDMIEELIREFLGSFSFSITMRWPGYGIQFPRPIRWVLAKLGKNTVNFEFGGLKSSKTSRGHYVHADKKITIDDIDDYQKILKRFYVLADPEERKEYLKATIDRALKYTSGHAVKYEKLLEEVNNSLEYPTGVKGEFPEKYLKMPREVIEACLIHHQKYFPVEDEDGNLLNCFVGVRDGISEFLVPIRSGYEKVLIARLEDAEFFLNKDRQHTLRDHGKKLRGIEFTRGLGNLYDKTQRCVVLSGFIAKLAGKDDKCINIIKKIAELSKIDLTTYMVGEFPELEGKIGRIYARMDGEEKKVYEGIYQQYLPRTYEDEVPKLDEAAIAGIADRIDSLVGNMGTGVEATGSQDPFGMRRICRGLIRILVKKKMYIYMDNIINECRELYLNQKIKFDDTDIVKMIDFIFLQIKNYLEEIFSYDIVRCVCSMPETAGSGVINILNPGLLFEIAKAVEKTKKSRDFDSLITAFKRINNILKQAKEKKIDLSGKIDTKKLKETAEKELYKKYKEVNQEVHNNVHNNDFTAVLKILTSLRQTVDRFFDEVLVMDPDQNIMKNRLLLLRHIIILFAPVGDISKLELK